MTETKHTPGPWEVAEPHPTKACNYINGPDGHEVAVVFSVAGDTDAECWEKCCADTHLIAAAPDMLAALKEGAQCLEDVARGEGGWAWEEVLDGMRAAIAKATGGE